MRHRISRAGARAFTLIEVMIAILIVVAIGALAAYNLMGAKKKADSGLGTIDFQTLQKGLKQFYYDHNRYPTDEEGVKVLWDKTAMTDEEESKKWEKILENPLPTDHWGNPWKYSQKSEHGVEDMYDLSSAGPDKQEGTDDDLVSWSKDSDASANDASSKSTKGPPAPSKGG